MSDNLTQEMLDPYVGRDLMFTQHDRQRRGPIKGIVLHDIDESRILVVSFKWCAHRNPKGPWREMHLMNGMLTCTLASLPGYALLEDRLVLGNSDEGEVSILQDALDFKEVLGLVRRV